MARRPSPDAPSPQGPRQLSGQTMARSQRRIMASRDAGSKPISTARLSQVEGRLTTPNNMYDNEDAATMSTHSMDAYNPTPNHAAALVPYSSHRYNSIHNNNNNPPDVVPHHQRPAGLPPRNYHHPLPPSLVSDSTAAPYDDQHFPPQHYPSPHHPSPHHPSPQHHDPYPQPQHPSPHPHADPRHYGGHQRYQGGEGAGRRTVPRDRQRAQQQQRKWWEEDDRHDAVEPSCGYVVLKIAELMLCLAVVVVSRVGSADLSQDVVYTMFGFMGLLVASASLLLIWIRGHPSPGSCLHTTMLLLYVIVVPTLLCGGVLVLLESDSSVWTITTALLFFVAVVVFTMDVVMMSVALCGCDCPALLPTKLQRRNQGQGKRSNSRTHPLNNNYPPGDPRYDPRMDRRHPRYDPTYDPRYDPQHPSFDPRYDPRLDPQHPRYDAKYDPRYDPKHPSYDPRIDPNHPQYRPKYDPYHPGYALPHDRRYDPRSSKYDPRLDPKHRRYEPRFDPRHSRYDPRYDPDYDVDISHHEYDGYHRGGVPPPHPSALPQMNR